MRISDWSSDVCSSDLPGVEAVKERLLYRQLIECARCFEEGVLETPEDGEIGAIFGWGFAPYTGGPFSNMDTVGIGAVVAVLDRRSEEHTSELQSLMRISYAVLCLKKKKIHYKTHYTTHT